MKTWFPRTLVSVTESESLRSSNGQISALCVWFSGKGNDADEEDFETFKGLNRGRNIPEDSMVNIISFGNVTILHPEYVIYLICNCTERN